MRFALGKTALSVGSAEAARSPHLPVDSASETGAKLAVCRTGAAALGADVTGPSLPACPLVATIFIILSFSNLLRAILKTTKPRIHKLCIGVTNLLSFKNIRKQQNRYS